MTPFDASVDSYFADTLSVTKARATVPEGRLPGTAARSLADTAARLTTDAIATGDAPSPGPIPEQTTPKQDTPRDQPIAFQFPYAVNQTITPRGESHALTPFAQLRAVAEVCDVVRIAVECRKDLVTGLNWDFAPRDRAKRRAPTDDERRRVDSARTFFAKPDREHDLGTWLRMALEDVLVVDALSIFKRRTRGKTLYALELVDGTTIKPLLDARGRTPFPPAIAYRQVIYGRPVQGGDCTRDDLMYRPRIQRTWTPYGLSPTEAVLLAVNTALNRGMFNLAHYSEGNIPEGLMSAPAEWTPEQIKAYQTMWDSLLSGNMAARSRLRIVGKGMAESTYQFKKPDFTTKFDEWLVKVVCAAFAVPPQELGFSQDVNRAQGQMQENVTYRRAVRPTASFFKGIFDEVLACDLELPDVEAIYMGGEPEDKLVQARVDDLHVRIGLRSIDELRARDGEDMIGMGPAIFLSSGPVFVEQLVAGKDNDPLTTSLKDELLGAIASLKPAADDANRTSGETKPTDGETKDAPPEPGDEHHETIDAAAEKVVDEELQRWRRVALNNVKAGRVAVRKRFETTVLSPVIVEAVSHSLQGATSIAEVVGVFDGVKKARAEQRIRAKGQRAYAAFMKTWFADVGEALSSHLEAGITSIAE